MGGNPVILAAQPHERWLGFGNLKKGLIQLARRIVPICCRLRKLLTRLRNYQRITSTTCQGLFARGCNGAPARAALPVLRCDIRSASSWTAQVQMHLLTRLACLATRFLSRRMRDYPRETSSS